MPIHVILGRAAYCTKSRKIPDKIERILFFKSGALGDIIMTTPLVRSIRRKFPYATIDYACGKSYCDALTGNKNINIVVPFDEKIIYSRDLAALHELAKRLKENKYDLIFVMDRHWACGVLASFIGGFRIGFDRRGEGFANNVNVTYKQNKHDIDAYLDLGIYLRIRPDSSRPEIFFTKDDAHFARKFCNYVCIAPGGGSNAGQACTAKRWPKRNFLRVANELSCKNNVILLGGSGDAATCKWIASRAKRKNKIKNLCGKTTIGEAAAILKKSRLVLCNDSGIMHIASCVNDRIISLFGPTDPRVLAPRGRRSTYIWKEKTPCYDIYGDFSKCQKNIMEKITVEDVLNATKR
jgi:lipopolysaccharide heptosyltransferase II